MFKSDIVLRLEKILGIEGFDQDKGALKRYFYVEELVQGDNTDTYNQSGCEVIATTNYKLVIFSDCKINKNALVNLLAGYFIVLNANTNRKSVYASERNAELKDDGCWVVRINFQETCDINSCKDDCLFECSC